MTIIPLGVVSWCRFSCAHMLNVMWLLFSSRLLHEHTARLVTLLINNWSGSQQLLDSQVTIFHQWNDCINIKTGDQVSNQSKWGTKPCSKRLILKLVLPKLSWGCCVLFSSILLSTYYCFCVESKLILIKKIMKFTRCFLLWSYCIFQ